MSSALMWRGVMVPRISRILIRGKVTLSPALRRSLVSKGLPRNDGVHIPDGPAGGLHGGSAAMPTAFEYHAASSPGRSFHTTAPAGTLSRSQQTHSRTMTHSMHLFPSRSSRTRSTLQAAVVLLILATSGLSGCVYRIDIQQGNFLEAKDIDRVTVGMTRVQVRALLGTPM